MHFLIDNKECTVSQPFKAVCKQEFELKGRTFPVGRLMSLRIVDNVGSLFLVPGVFKFNLKALTTEEQNLLSNLTYYEENKEIVNALIVDEVYVDEVILFINNFNRSYRTEIKDLWLETIGSRDGSGSYELIFNSTMKTGCELVRAMKKHGWYENALFEYDVDVADLQIYK